MARLTDGHCHVLPVELRPLEAASWQDRWFADCHTPRALFADGGAVMDAVRRDGLERAVISGWPFRDPGLLREVNDFVAEEVSRSGGALVGLATVNPLDPAALSELDRCLGLGLVGVGELNQDAQGFNLEFEGRLRKLLEACAEAGTPVLLHCSEPVGHSYPGKGRATPDRLWRLLSDALEEVPALRVCLAHLGGGLAFYAHMPEVDRLCQRLWFDTAAIPYLYGSQILPVLGGLIASDRVCFGSDFPLLRPRRYQAQLAALSDDQRLSLQGRAVRGWLGEV